MPGFQKTISYVWKYPKTNIFECMVLHYLFLKLNGYACFTISGPIETGKIRTSILDRLWFLWHLTLALTLWYCTMWVIEEPKAFSPLMVIGNRLIWITCYLTAVCGIVWNFIHRDKVWSLYTGVYNVDKQLLSEGAVMFYTRTYFVMIGLSLVGMVWLVVLVFAHFREEGFDLVSFLTFFYSNISLTMLVTIFYIAGNLVSIRLWILNDLMEKNLIPSRKSKLIQVKEKDQMQTIKVYMQCYDQLCDLTETVNLCYSGQTMIAVAGSFVYLLFFAFGIILYIKRGEPLTNLSLSQVVWSIFYLCNILMIVGAGSRIRTQLRLFLMQLGHRSPALTCGLFPFDWTLVYSIMATSTTYLIILIQFENSRPA